MKAITTKYHGPSNTRGSRISASDMDRNRVTVHYDSAQNSDANHRRAADALCAKMQWRGDLSGGSIKGGQVFVFVTTDQRPSEIEGYVISELRLLGCKCQRPLIGWRPGKGPRCRLCNTEAGFQGVAP